MTNKRQHKPILGVIGFCLSLLVTIFTSLAAGVISPETIHHDLRVVMHPKEHAFVAEDTVTIPNRFLPEFHFLLHKGLDPSSSTSSARIVKEHRDGEDSVFESYTGKLPKGENKFVIKYRGVISHPLELYGKEQARGFSRTPGVISEEGVYLSGSSFWYPRFDNETVTFNLRLELPPEWDAVSQGERTDYRKDKSSTSVQWESPEPQEEIFLVAARFHEYTRSAGKTLAMVFLRTPDKGLPEKYLEATVRYISMYDKLIGPYPYKKFALVENFWESGFGMPSFTLLGPKVIRFPFIIDTSYPHEILHNWWGNSVFPDYEKGNWSEGLTAYLSDCLLKEQKGEGTEYRLTTLQKYADYVISGRDFPLTEFRSRHSPSSEAIGYGKSLMFFHMLRLELRDGDFIEGLRDFYQRNKFEFVSFDDIRQSFERVSGKDLKREFDQWVTKPGAPQLRLKDVETVADGPRYLLSAVIEQTHHRPTYLLRIPVAITVEGKEKAYQTTAVMSSERIEVKLDLPSRPLRIDVDPEFDVFRRLDRDEIPPAISQALGARKLLVILPSTASRPVLKSYREFADSLSRSGPDEVKTILDTEISRLPSDQSVVILGWENLFLDQMVSALSGYGTTMSRKSARIGKTEIPFENHSVALTARNTENRDFAMMFIASDPSDALPGLARKLPHYHKYSYLVFEGAEPVNIAKGRWSVSDSPMTVYLPAADGTITRVAMGRLEPRKPLITLQTDLSAELKSR